MLWTVYEIVTLFTEYQCGPSTIWYVVRRRKEPLYTIHSHDTGHGNLLPRDVQCRTLKHNKFCSGSRSSFWSFLTPPLCSEWQNTSKNALWGFSHDFLGVANFFGPKIPAPNPNLGSEASAHCLGSGHQ